MKGDFLKKVFVLHFIGAQAFGAPTTTDAFEFFEEEAKAVTASRRLQPIQDSPVAVEVITAEDIHASGVTSVWDLLRFRAGMNVMEGRSIEGNRAVVSVRGFAGEFVGNLQVLVDGRSVYQALTNGVYWQQIPVQVQDLERIEIVRGPNAALYGSNAGLGVINMITKKPQAKAAATLNAIAGNRGTVIGSGAAEGALRNFHFRLSHTYRENEGFPLASTGETANDFLHLNKSNLRGAWSPTDQTALEVFAGGAWMTSGLPPSEGEQAEFAQDFQMLKLAHTLPTAGVLEGVVSRNHLLGKQSPSVPDEDTVSVLQYDGELLHRLGWGNERLYTTSGISFRKATARSATFFVGQDKSFNETVRAFVNQSLDVTKKLSLVGAVSVEHATIGGTQPAYQAAALYHLVPDHGLRVSYSLAPTMPSIYRHNANHHYSDTPPLQVMGNENIEAQKLSSYELGYRGKVHNLQADASVFYMTIRDFENRSFTFVPQPTTLMFGNADKAIARGAEASVRYEFKQGPSVYANYTYEHITSALRTLTVDKGTPSHMVNMGGIAPLGRGFLFSANIGYKDAYSIESASRGTTVAAPAHTRVDGRLGYVPPFFPSIETFVSCQNITDAGHVEFSDGLQVPRTYWGGVTMKFGNPS